MRNSKCAGTPAATVGMLVMSVRPMIVMSGGGMCARFCEIWLPLVHAAEMRRTDKAIAVRMTSISHRSDILDFDLLELLPARLELERGAHRHRTVRAADCVDIDECRCPERDAFRLSGCDRFVERLRVGPQLVRAAADRLHRHAAEVQRLGELVLHFNREL